MSLMSREEAIAKIRKCLALAKSANEHEAAAALRQAKALMDKYQVDENDHSLLGIVEFGAISGATVRPPRWECMLARVVANYFDCDIFYKEGVQTSKWQYMGIDPSPEIAVYSFDVLIRQLRAARKDYIATQLKRVRNKTNKIARADAFCEGWVITASVAMGKINPNTEIIARIKHYQATAHRNLTDMKPSTRKVTKAIAQQQHADKYNGMQSGENAQLHTAMNGGKAPTLIGD